MKRLIATATIAAIAFTVASPASARLRIMNGVESNGVTTNGLGLNGLGLNGLGLNGLGLNGVSMQGVSHQGISHQGVEPNGLVGSGQTLRIDVCESSSPDRCQTRVGLRIVSVSLPATR